jgi:hypothetical protein
MEQSVHGHNLANFSELLGTERDPMRQATLMRLLVEEENQLGLGSVQFAIADRVLRPVASIL